MPYKDPEAQKEYQRRWVAQRRQEWFDAHGPCCLCGSPEQLELDHVDPAHKISHRLWSWSALKREAELAKCRVLCLSCHRQKSKGEQQPRLGELNGHCKLSTEQVLEILATTESSSAVAARYGVKPGHIRMIRSGHNWKHLQT